MQRDRLFFLPVLASFTLFLGGCGGSTEENEPVVPTDNLKIEAPLERWTWVPFDDAFCGNGSTTGIGVNLTDKSKNLAIFLMGGGACWDYETCFVDKRASHFDEDYQEPQFKGEIAIIGSLGSFQRSNVQSPIRDYNFVYVPYCTGDVHAGSNIADYNGTKAYHVGYQNIQAYLKRIVATFPDPERVLLMGVSAGGFGSGMNWWQVQQAFPNVRVDMLDDSGPLLPPPYLSETLEGVWREQWDLNAGFPPDCAECANSLGALFGYYTEHFTTQRAALLSYTQDGTISNYLQLSGPEFEAGLGALTQTYLDGQPNFKYYFVTGDKHVLLINPENTSQNGVVLSDWWGQMMSDDPAWESVRP